MLDRLGEVLERLLLVVRIKEYVTELLVAVREVRIVLDALLIRLLRLLIGS